MRSGTVKIADLPTQCRHPEHNPPTHRLFSPGIYMHTCPWCGHTQKFIINENWSVTKGGQFGL